MSLLESYVGNRAKADARLLKMLFREPESGLALLQEELDDLNSEITNGNATEASKRVQEIKERTSYWFSPRESDNVKDRKFSRLRTISAILDLKDDSVTDAVLRLLEGVSQGRISSEADFRILGLLLHCYRRKDKDEYVEQVRDRLREILHQQPAFELFSDSKEIVRIIDVIARAYFGLRETGGWLTSVYCGLAEEDNWIQDMVQTYKAFYIHPQTHVVIEDIRELLVKIVNARLKEIEFAQGTSFRYPSLFNEKDTTDLQTLHDALSKS